MPNHNSPQQPTEPLTLRGIKNIARYCGPGVSHHQVEAAVKAGRLPVLEGTGREHVVLTEDVIAWLRSRRDPGRGAA